MRVTARSAVLACDCGMAYLSLYRLAELRCAQIARRQYGVISRAQALAAGMTPDMIDYRIATGRWEILYRSVYRIAGAPPSQLGGALAACLAGGEDTFLWGPTAAAGWGLEGGRWTPVHLASQRQIRLSGGGLITHRIASISSREVTRLGRLPITSPSRTILDLAGVLDERELEIALDQGVNSGRIDLVALRLMIERRVGGRLPGLGRLRRLVDERDPNAPIKPTELETLTRRWLKRYKFPEPVFQYWVPLPDYGHSRLDFAYPDCLVGIEADSYAWHTGRDAFERDRRRLSDYASLGWIIIQTTYREIEENPDRPARQLRRAIDKRLFT